MDLFRPIFLYFPRRFSVEKGASRNFALVPRCGFRLGKSALIVQYSSLSF